MRCEYLLFQTEESCSPERETVRFSTKNRARETWAQCLQLRNEFHQSHSYCLLSPLVVLVGLRSDFHFSSHSQHYYFPLCNFWEKFNMNQIVLLVPTKERLFFFFLNTGRINSGQMLTSQWSIFERGC